MGSKRIYIQSALALSTLEKVMQEQRSLLKVNDSFKLKETVAPNSVSFMTWGNVKKESDGKIAISVEGVNAQLTYDPKIFDCNIETIALTDHILSDVWGDKVYRLSFTTKKLAKSGKYSFTVTKR